MAEIEIVVEQHLVCLLIAYHLRLNLELGRAMNYSMMSYYHHYSNAIVDSIWYITLLLFMMMCRRDK